MSRTACLVSHAEYAPRALLRLEKKTPLALLTFEKNGGIDRPTTPDRNITLSARAGQSNT